MTNEDIANLFIKSAELRKEQTLMRNEQINIIVEWLQSLEKRIEKLEGKEEPAE